MTISDRWNTYFSKPAPNLALRLVVLLLGYAFIALGVAVSRSTGLGVSPISSIPNVLSYVLPQLTVGQWTLIINMIFLVIQIVLLRRNFKPVQLLQIPATIVFSMMIDLFVPLAEMIPQPAYWANMLVIIASIFIMALGVFLEVRAELVPLPGEGISVTISNVFKLPFHKCKVGTDVTNVTLGALISLVCLHYLTGVREGTVVVAVCTGFVVKFYSNLVPNFNKWVPTKGLWEIQ